MNALERSYAYAEKVARRRARNFYYTFRFLPPERRRSIFAVYTYSRRLDDAVDSVEERAVQPQEARAELQRLEALLAGGGAPDDPLAPALEDTIRRYRIPLEHFRNLVAGMEMDLEQRRYRTFDELYLYCYRAASAVGLISIEIFGHAGPDSYGPAEELGIAMQLTNILRDVAEDWRRGRIYLPGEDLERFGYTEADLARGTANDAFRALMAFEAGRAREYFARSEALFPLIRPESRYCPLLLKRFYSSLLDRIERMGYDVLSRRPRLPALQKLWIAGRAWIEREISGCRGRPPRGRSG